MNKRIFNIGFFITFITTAFSQSYILKQNIVMISECENPKKGFKIIGQTTQKSANSDRFILSVSSKTFEWNDSKGNSINPFSNYQSKILNNGNSQCVFFTSSNVVRITTNKNKEAVVEIICLINNNWFCLSYLCSVF